MKERERHYNNWYKILQILSRHQFDYIHLFLNFAYIVEIKKTSLRLQRITKQVTDMLPDELTPHRFSSISTADTCKNCAKCGKGFKIGTNEAYNIKIKIRLGSISKIFCFCSHANMAASEKGISLKKKFLKKFLLNVTN